MPQLTLEDVLPIVRDLADRKANAFIRRCCLPISARCDVQSELVVRFLTRWPKFDEEKSSIRTFASRVMDHELASIWRSQIAQCRQVKSSPEEVGYPSVAALRQFWFDVSRAIASLPRETRETALALCELSARDTAGAKLAAAKVLELEPTNGRVQILLATMHFDANEKDLGRAALEKYLALEPNGAHVQEARALLKR